MKFLFYFGIYHYLTIHTYQEKSNAKLNKRIKNWSRRYIACDGKLFLKRSTSSPIEILHDVNMEDVVKRIHNEGHFGITNTWRRIRLFYDGYRLFNVVKKIVEECETCQFRSRRT